MLGAATGAALFGITSLATDFGTPWAIALAALATHLASQLILLALFMEPSPSGRGRFRRADRSRGSGAVVVTLLAFVPTQLPAALFLILPMLGWAALRAPMREALWQLVTVGVIANTLVTLGRGPFVAIEVLRDRPSSWP